MYSILDNVAAGPAISQLMRRKIRCDRGGTYVANFNARLCALLPIFNRESDTDERKVKQVQVKLITPTHV